MERLYTDMPDEARKIILREFAFCNKMVILTGAQA